MRTLPWAVALALLLLRVSCAQDAMFNKSGLITAGVGKLTPVDLIISDVGVIIRSKGNMASVVLDLPYSAITKMGYASVDQRKASLVPLIGVTALFLKGQSHWLVIESSHGAEKGKTVLRLDKTEYLSVVGALTSRSGKPVELIAPGSAKVDPTAGSHDEDETVPFPIDRVLAEVKPAMEQYSCKVGKSDASRIECTRGLRPPDGIGGSETVVAFLLSNGQETRVQIKTQKGLGRNWSLPIYREMLRRLQPAQ